MSVVSKMFKKNTYLWNESLSESEREKMSLYIYIYIYIT